MIPHRTEDPSTNSVAGSTLLFVAALSCVQLIPSQPPAEMTRPETTDFGDLVESAAIFSSTTAPPSLDGIPRLSRTLHQVSESSLDVLRSRPANGDAVQADALRLLANRGFRSDKLRLALQQISESSPFVVSAAPHRFLAGDAAQLLQIQRAAVSTRAADEARLSANTAFQFQFNADMKDDLINSRSHVVDLMETVVRNRPVVNTPKQPKQDSHFPSTPSRTPQRQPFSTPHRPADGASHQSPWTPRTPASRMG